MWISIRFSKYLGYGSSLKAYPQIGNIIPDNNFGLNLCVVPTVCCVVIILNDEVLGWTNLV